MKILSAILIGLLANQGSFAAEAAPLPVQEMLQRIPTRVGEQLVFARASGNQNDSTGFYKWSGPAGAAERYSLSVRVQSFDSEDAARQGFTKAMALISVLWTRQEDFRGTRLYIWDTTMGSGEKALRVGPSARFRLDNDVVQIDVLDKTAGGDFLMKAVEAVYDELKAVRK